MREAGRKLRVLCGAGQESTADFIYECDGEGLSRKGDTGCNIMKPPGQDSATPYICRLLEGDITYLGEDLPETFLTTPNLPVPRWA